MQGVGLSAVIVLNISLRSFSSMRKVFNNLYKLSVESDENVNIFFRFHKKY